MVLTNKAMCPGMHLLCLVCGGLAVLLRGPPKPTNLVQAQSILNMLQFCVSWRIPQYPSVPRTVMAHVVLILFKNSEILLLFIINTYSRRDIYKRCENYRCGTFRRKFKALKTNFFNFFF
jgi:hypothetical protein